MKISKNDMWTIIIFLFVGAITLGSTLIFAATNNTPKVARLIRLAPIAWQPYNKMFFAGAEIFAKGEPIPILEMELVEFKLPPMGLDEPFAMHFKSVKDPNIVIGVVFKFGEKDHVQLNHFFGK